MLGAVDRSYTTARHRPEHQFDSWRGFIGDAFTPVLLESRVADAREGFDAACQARRVGDLTVSWLRSAPQRVERTAALTASAGCDAYFVNLALRGGSHATQEGRTAQLSAGDFVVIDGDRPFELDFAVDFEQVCVTVPKAVLDPALIDVTSATGLRVRGDAGIGAVAAAAILGLARHSGRMGERAANAATLHVVGLMSAALDAEAPPAAGRRVALFRALLDDIELHYSSPEYSLFDAARRISISTSYATKLFAENRTSFGRRLMLRRLDHAWTLLAQVASGVSITDIALRCGFCDPAHFSRAFRFRFGMTPTERRAGAVRRDPSSVRDGAGPPVSSVTMKGRG
ncbi:helix-turn-helix domain-containing protein [Microbacterium sp. NPDC089318]